MRRQAAALADLRARAPALDQREAQALNSLTLLTGNQPGQLQSLLNEEAGRPPLALPALDLGLPSALAQRRPDIGAAEARLHAATAAIGVARAELYPRITLGARLGSEAVEANTFGDFGSRLWSVGPSFSLPLFDQGRRRAVVQLRSLEQQEAAVAYQQTVLRAWHEVDGSLSSYGAARLRDAALGDKHANAAAAEDLARAAYRRGLTDILPALEARGSLLQVEREQAQSRTAMAQALIGIVKATGVAP